MKRFSSLLEEAEFANTFCGNWSFATSNDMYDVKGLLIFAEISDSENFIDEDSYQTFPQVNICLQCGSSVVIGTNF